MIRRRTFLSLAIPGLLLALTGCASAQTTRPSTRILFVGNSYTFYNGGIDKILTEMAQQRGVTIECATSTSPGKSLEWHYNEGNAREMIARGGWDWVVLQDYSLQPLDKRDLMFEYARKFAPLIKQTGAKIAFYMTWPRENQPENLKTIADAYTSIAKELGATVVPVGIAWQQASKQDANLKLYRSDRSHPTAEGSYLAASCFYRVLLNADPRGLPSMLIFEETSLPRTLSEGTVKPLQESAWQTTPSKAP